jgi:O-antigen/teichoic acid export membrane protein
MTLSPTSRQLPFDELAKDALSAIAIQISGLGLTYLVQVCLARWMGRTEYGIYEYVMSCSLLLGIPACLGFPFTVLRLIPEYRVKQEWGRLQGLVRGSWLLTVLTSLSLVLIAAIVIQFVNQWHPFVYATPLMVGLGLVLMQALVLLQQETGRAIGDISLAFIPSQIILPSLILLSGAFLLTRDHRLTSLPMIEVVTALFLVVISFQLWLLWRKFNQEFEAATPVYAYREWLEIALNLLIQTASFIILNQTDVVMIGSILGPEDSGIYNAAVKTSMWASFVLQIVNMVAGPTYTTLYAQGKIQELQKVVSRVTIWIFCPSLVITLFLLTFTQPVLSLFGNGFIAASWSLKVLALGQLVNALCGSVGFLMIVTGHQNQSLPVVILSAVTNIVLNAILIPKFGTVGAAIATAFSMALWNIWLTILVVQHIGVRPSIFYSLFGQTDSDTLDLAE